MLTVRDLRAKGRHAPLVRPTSFSVSPGELILVQAPSQLTRTGLSLILTGRMKPQSGSVEWFGDDRRQDLRRISDLMDSPGVNEMENHMRVRDYVSEMLSYQPHPFLRRPHSGRWLEENGLGDLNNLWDEQLSGEQRIRLMVALAASNQDADLLVFDTPSRHANHSVTWIPRLIQLAQDPQHPRAVVAVVPHISTKWNGPTAIVGGTHEDTVPEQEHAPEPSPPGDDADYVYQPPTRLLGGVRSESLDVDYGLDDDARPGTTGLRAPRTPLEELFDLDAAEEELREAHKAEAAPDAEPHAAQSRSAERAAAAEPASSSAPEPSTDTHPDHRPDDPSDEETPSR